MSSASSAGSGGNSNALVYFFGALGGLLFGYDTGVISGAIQYIQDDLGTNALLNGLIVSGLLIGAMIGAGTAGPLSDRLGRRNFILIAAVIFSVGAIGAAISLNVATLVFFRVVLEVAVGAAALIVPLYLSEVAPTEIRGAVASLNQLMIVSGILTAFIVNYTLSEAEALDARARRDPFGDPAFRDAVHAGDPALARKQGPRRRGAPRADAHPEQGRGGAGDPGHQARGKPGGGRLERT